MKFGAVLLYQSSGSLTRLGFPNHRAHADDTTVPVLAKGKTPTGRLWTYVRDDRLFGECRAFSAVSQKASFAMTAWWTRQDSNLQPDRYERLSDMLQSPVAGDFLIRPAQTQQQK